MNLYSFPWTLYAIPSLYRRVKKIKEKDSTSNPDYLFFFDDIPPDENERIRGRYDLSYFTYLFKHSKLGKAKWIQSFLLSLFYWDQSLLHLFIQRQGKAETETLPLVFAPIHSP